MKNVKSFITQNKKITTFIILVMLAIILMAISGGNRSTDFKSVNVNIFSGIQGTFTGISYWLGNTFDSIKTLEKTKAELETVQKELLKYKEFSQKYITLEKRNEELAKLLDLAQETQQAYSMITIPAEIIAKQPGNLFALITINRGSKHGITKQMPVIARVEGKTGLVGKVYTVGDSSCTVLPIFNPSFHATARLENTRIEGIVSGQGATSYRLILKNVIVFSDSQWPQYGDMVVTAGLGGVFPKDINIGTIRNNRENYNKTLEWYIEPVIDFTKLEYVVILKTQ